MLARTTRILGSLELGLWLMAGVTLLLAIGSFAGGGESGINDLPLFVWLKESGLAQSWWLWACIALLGFLALNTVLCSIDSLRKKRRHASFLVVIAPQVMHAGFLFIVLAHLFSAAGGFKEVLQIDEGSVIRLPDGSPMALEAFQASYSRRGMPTGMSAAVRYPVNGGTTVEVISPNHPCFRGGYGIYLKDLVLYPERIALVEIHREPGAGLALAGALLFAAGNVVLLVSRRTERQK